MSYKEFLHQRAVYVTTGNVPTNNNYLMSQLLPLQSLKDVWQNMQILNFEYFWHTDDI